MDRTIQEFKISTKCWFNWIVLCSIWKSSNSSAQDHFHHHQTTKLHAHNIKQFHSTLGFRDLFRKFHNFEHKVYFIFENDQHNVYPITFKEGLSYLPGNRSDILPFYKLEFSTISQENISIDGLGPSLARWWDAVPFHSRHRNAMKLVLQSW